MPMQTLKTALEFRAVELKNDIRSKMIKVDGEDRNVPELLVGERCGITYALHIIEKLERGENL